MRIVNRHSSSDKLTLFEIAALGTSLIYIFRLTFHRTPGRISTY